MFKERSNVKELIDNFDLKGPELVKNLQELHTINKFLGGYNINIQGIKHLLKERPLKAHNPLTIVDLGSGGGDSLNVMAKWLKSRKIEARLYGVDANPSIINYATKNCSNYRNISFLQENALEVKRIPFKPDIVFFSLFFHHFSEMDIQTILRNILHFKPGLLIINDLHRHFLAYYSIKLLTRLFSGSYLVKNDAPLSVKRGFKRSELEAILVDSGIEKYNIQWGWAFRWKVLIFDKI
jgi:ubiquinone/menaquinone biosynthesis C-methylase UbiE